MCSFKSIFFKNRYHVIIESIVIEKYEKEKSCINYIKRYLDTHTYVEIHVYTLLFFARNKHTHADRIFLGYSL